MEARQAHERIRLLQGQARQLRLVGSGLILLLGMAVLYLLFVQAENHLLREKLGAMNVSSDMGEVGRGGGGRNGTLVEKDADGEEEGEDMGVGMMPLMESMDDFWMVAQGGFNSSFSFFLFRPHYSIFVPSPLRQNGTNPIGLWLLSPYCMYLALAQQFVRVSTLLYAYCLVLVLLQILKRFIGTPFWMSLVEPTPRVWLKGVLFRTGLLVFLSAEIFLMETFVENPAVLEYISSLFVLLFIVGCFFSGRSYLALMWSLFVSSAIHAIPLFSTEFPLFCPWRETDCMVPIGKFFVASEWGLLMLALPHVRME